MEDGGVAPSYGLVMVSQTKAAMLQTTTSNTFSLYGDILILIQICQAYIPIQISQTYVPKGPMDKYINIGTGKTWCRAGSNITATIKWPSWRLELPVNREIVQQFICSG